MSNGFFSGSVFSKVLLFFGIVLFFSVLFVIVGNFSFEKQTELVTGEALNPANIRMVAEIEPIPAYFFRIPLDCSSPLDPKLSQQITVERGTYQELEDDYYLSAPEVASNRYVVEGFGDLFDPADPDTFNPDPANPNSIGTPLPVFNSRTVDVPSDGVGCPDFVYLPYHENTLYIGLRKILPVADPVFDTPSDSYQPYRLVEDIPPGDSYNWGHVACVGGLQPISVFGGGGGSPQEQDSSEGGGSSGPTGGIFLLKEDADTISEALRVCGGGWETFRVSTLGQGSGPPRSSCELEYWLGNGVIDYSEYVSGAPGGGCEKVFWKEEPFPAVNLNLLPPPPGYGGVDPLDSFGGVHSPFGIMHGFYCRYTQIGEPVPMSVDC